MYPAEVVLYLNFMVAEYILVLAQSDCCLHLNVCFNTPFLAPAKDRVVVEFLICYLR